MCSHSVFPYQKFRIVRPRLDISTELAFTNRDDYTRMNILGSVLFCSLCQCI